MKSWMPALGMSVYLWLSVPFVRPVISWFRARGLLRFSIGLIVLVLVVGVTNSFAKRGGFKSFFRTLVLVLISCIYVLIIRYWVFAPEEGIHFIQAGFLAYLFYRPLSEKWISPGRAAGAACAFAAIVVALEETIQICVPSRVFDWQDIARGIVGSFLALPLLVFVLVPRKKTDTLKEFPL
ncbi:MAG: VanZ family protein [Elusimicrobiota bacterium]|jgi:hypothetical protein